MDGKKLMSKCKQLMEENRELGMERYEGRVHQFECEIALYKKHTSNIKRDYQG
jgi:hypothetical protein